MLVSKLKEALSLEPVTTCEMEQNVTTCYIGDMLSVVMAKAPEGAAWLTVQSNINIVAVASLTGIACIIVVEGMEPEEATIKKAEEQGIPIFKFSGTAYSLACKIQELL